MTTPIQRHDDCQSDCQPRSRLRHPWQFIYQLTCQLVFQLAFQLTGQFKQSSRLCCRGFLGSCIECTGCAERVGWLGYCGWAGCFRWVGRIGRAGVGLVGLVGLLGLVGLNGKANAEPVTQTYLAHNSTSESVSRSHLPYANPNAPKGGTLSLQALGTFNAANKWMTTGVAMAGTSYMYDTLMSGSLDEAFTMYPQLAEKVTYDPDDASWVIYHINPKARFWDQSSVTASDVKATFEALLTQGPMHIRSYLADIKEVEVLDKYRAKFHFASADGNAINKEMVLTVGQFPIFQAASIKADFDKVTLTPLMGSGAYQLDKVDAGRSVSYRRDPNYWGQSLMVNRGRYNFDTIQYIYYLSHEIAFEGFKSGQYQWREENKSRNWATAYDFPAVRTGQVLREEIDNRNPVAMQGLVMNLRRPLFANIRVRQALTHAFDFEWMNATLFYQQYQRLQSYFYHSELEATGTPSEAEMQVIDALMPLIPKEQRQTVLSEWNLPDYTTKQSSKQPKQQPNQQSAEHSVKQLVDQISGRSAGQLSGQVSDQISGQSSQSVNTTVNHSHGQHNGYHREALLKARQLLLEAGFYYQDMKLHTPTGELAEFEILLVSGSPVTRVVLPYVRNLKRLGFTVRIREVDAPQYIQRVREYDYDSIVDVFAQGSSPGAEQMAYWGSQSADEKGNQNTVGIKNPAIDAVIERLTQADSREQVITHTKVLDRLLRAGYYMVPMYGKTTKNVAYWQQYRHAKLPSHAIGIDYWWVEE